MMHDRPSTFAPSSEIIEELGGLRTVSAPMRALFARVRRVASSPLPVLVTGETGAGKELVARALHDVSSWASGPFVAINCGALAATLVESELFGHVRGAFTGAVADKCGVFEAASGGTLFLDEIGELPLELQPRLLRVLETKCVRRIGGAREVSVDVRVVAATHRDLRAMVAAGRFREDLYHRLMILGVHVPPLRERPEDVALLARTVLAEATGGEKTFTAGADAALLAYAWPGNVRELRNVVLRAALLSDGTLIAVEDLELPRSMESTSEDEMASQGAADEKEGLSEKTVHPFRGAAPLRRALASLTLEEEREALIEALRACGDNRSRAARRLGISRSALHERLKRLGVPPRFSGRMLEAV